MNLRKRNKTQITNEIISLGNLSAAKRANGTMWFAHKVFPLIKVKIPKIKWHIVGKYPSKEIKGLNDDQNIIVHNFIEDIDSILINIDLCIIPLLEGTGRMMKIDTMTERQIPCVVTSLANRNSSLLENKEILV